MKYIMKRILSVILIIVIFCFNVPAFSDEIDTTSVTQNPTTDGSQSSYSWFYVFDSLLTDKAANGLKFFLVLNSLRGDEFEGQVTTVLNRDTTRKNLLSNYDLNADTIHNMMVYYMSTFPESMEKVVCCADKYGENIYADIYHDENIVYSKYMVRFQDYLNELFAQQPVKMQEVISKYDRLGAGEIIVMQGLMNIVIRDYLAFEEYDTRTLISRQQDLHLRPEIKSILYNELVRVAGTYTADYDGDTSIDYNEISNYIDAFYALGNVMLESMELNLKDSGMIDHIIDLAEDTNLLVKTPYTPSAPVIPVTLVMNTDFIELDSSVPVTDTSINEFQLIPTVTGTLNPVVYSVNKPNIINVDKNGFVTLGTETDGIVTITATVQGYNVYKEIIVEVSERTPAGAVEFYGAYISGYPDKTFRTDNYITRAEIATMFIRVLRLDFDENNDMLEKDIFDTEKFDDVKRSHWAFLYIELATQNGLMSGYADDTFKPNDPITRAEIAMIISNAWDLLGIAQSPLANHFIKDVEFEYWAYEAINKVYNAGIVSGYEDGTFRPDGLTTRGEIVIMVNGIIDRPVQKPVIPTFIDVIFEHWAYGNIEAATKTQEKKTNLEE